MPHAPFAVSGIFKTFFQRKDYITDSLVWQFIFAIFSQRIYADFFQKYAAY
jgi:hypothetical protein